MGGGGGGEEGRSKIKFPVWLKGLPVSNFEKRFSKFYCRHYELVSKFMVGLKPLSQQGLSEPEFYGILVYKFKNKKGCK